MLERFGPVRRIPRPFIRLVMFCHLSTSVLIDATLVLYVWVEVLIVQSGDVFVAIPQRRVSRALTTPCAHPQLPFWDT